MSWSPVDEEKRIADRAEKIEGWLEYAEEIYSELISRPEETSSVSGFHMATDQDSGPRTRPCECRAAWQRAHLCLACDNSGWRPCAPGEAGIDPYSAQVPKRRSFLLNESDGTRKAKETAQRYAVIASLERNERIRDGLEAPEDRETRTLRIVGHKSRMLQKILDALKQLLAVAPDAIRRPKHILARALAYIVQGRVYAPPLSA